MLLLHGADADRGMSENGTTNPMAAVQAGDVPIVKAMLARSRDVDRSDRFGQTPLTIAARAG